MSDYGGKMGGSSRLLAALLCFVFIEQVNARVEAVIGPVSINRNINIAIRPTSESENEILISRDQYVISYNPKRRSPNWVAWKLEKQDIGSVARQTKFSKDPDLDEYLSDNSEGKAVTSDEFKNSCFDRGHQVPSKDRTDNVTDNKETFIMSNVIPQTPYLNRVVWEHLEQYTRNLVQKYGKKVYVIAGPVYDQKFGWIGPNQDIPVPSKDFKILVVLDANQTPDDINSDTEVIAALIPNILKDGSKPVPGTAGCAGFDVKGAISSADDWKQYKTTIAEIEAVSGFHFGKLH